MSTLRGILVNDPRITAANIDDTLTTTDQAGPYPGAVVDGSTPPSNLTWRTSGTMATEDVFGVTATRGGVPGVQDRAAAFSYTRASGTTYYWDPPRQVSGVETINFVTSGGGTSSATKEYEPDLLRMADGRILLCTRTDTPSIRTRIYDPSDGTWASPVSITDATYVQDVQMGLCALQMPGAIYLYHAYQFELDGADRWQVAVWVSKDDGATWSLAQANALMDSLAATVTTDDLVLEMSAAYSAGQVSLAINILRSNGSHYSKAHWGSSDGLRFGYNPDGEATDPIVKVEPADGGGFMLHLGQTDGFASLPIPSAFAWFDAVYATVPTEYRWLGSSDLGSDLGYTDGDGFDWSEHMVCRSEDGVTYVLTVKALGTSAIGQMWRRTTDRGTWSELGEAIAFGGVEHFHRGSMAASRGQVLVAAELVTEDGEIDDGTITIFHLGGHTSQSMPPSAGTDSDTSRQGWDELYIAASDPGATSWTATGAGTETLEGSGLSLSCTSAQARYYDPTTTYSDDTAELMVEVEVGGVSGASSSGTTNQPRAGLDLVYTDLTNTNEYRLFVNFSATGFEVWDFHGATQLVSVVTDTSDASAPVSVRVLLFGARMAVYYRAGGANPSERRWLFAGSSSGVTSATNTQSTHRIRWGVISTIPSGTTTVDFRRVAFCEVAGGTISTIGVRALDGFGRPISARPMGLPSGLVLEAVDGPAAPGDVWAITTAYRYPFEHLHTPSPQQEWRSAGPDNTVQYITYDLAGFAEDADLMGSSIGVALIGSNLGAIALYGRTHAGVDTLLAAAASVPYPTSGAGYLAYERHGSVLVCPPSHSAEESGWIAHNQLAGGWVTVATGVSGGDAYRIKGNTSGYWNGRSADKQVRILLEDEDDPSSLAATGNINVIQPMMVAWAHDVTARYRYLRVRLAGHTYSNDYRIGRLMIGAVRWFGKQYGREVLLERNHNVQLTTRADGTRTAQNRGRQRRTATIAWRDGIDETGMYAGVPSWVSTSGGQIVAAMGDTARLLDGLFGEIDGPREPVVLISKAADTSDREANPDLFLYSRVTNGHVARQQFLGNEGVSGVFRVNELRFEEEL